MKKYTFTSSKPTSFQGKTATGVARSSRHNDILLQYIFKSN